MKVYVFLISLTFITFNPIITQANENITFDAWIKNIEELAINKGIASETIQKSLDGVVPNKRVLELDRMQPEFTLTLDTYLSCLGGAVKSSALFQRTCVGGRVQHQTQRM